MNMFIDSDSRFPLGSIHATPAVLRQVEPADISDALVRHRCGDWGMISASDVSRNEYALLVNRRVTSAYQDKHGVRFWITTEPDRSKTTVLLPRDNRDNNRPQAKRPQRRFSFFSRLLP